MVEILINIQWSGSPGRTILSGATGDLPAGRRIGLVGRNGTGKTTLLASHHAARWRPTAGSIEDGRRAWRVGSAGAGSADRTDVSLIETVLAADRERTRC